MSALLAIAAAAALYGKNAPETTRARIVAPFFAPRPGQPFALEERDLKNARKTPALKMRGYIDVTPPKGTCFTIELSDEDPDEVVCKPTKVFFTVSQLDRTGHLSWRVSTGDGDAGTDLVWPSPYRLAFVTPWDARDDDPQVYRFIEACEPSAAPEGGRKITLRLLGGEDWTIRFPDHDKMLPQPDDAPNLFIYASAAKVSVTQAAENHAHEKARETHEGGESEAPKPPPPKATGSDVEPSSPKDPNNMMADRKWWAIPLRGAYEMPASAFQPNGSVTPGMRGRCRYNFDGGAQDPGVGRLECHEVDGFKSVLIPLTCIKDLGPRK